MNKIKLQLTLYSLIFCLILVPGITKASTELSNLVTFSGETADDGAGSALSAAGDVNGDGYDDYIIGAPSYGTNAGAVYLVYGAAEKLTGVELSDASIVKFTAENDNDMAGGSLASAGDINGDGFDDILISASSKDSARGSVYLLYGKADNYASMSLSDSSFIEITGEAYGNAAGSSIASAGDVNNDGFDDILISATGNGDGGDYAGAVYLIYGRAAALTDMSLGGSSVIQFTGEAENNSLASGLSSGDLNGDGYSDLVLSTSSADDYTGAIYIIYGQPETLSLMTVNSSTAVKIAGEAAENGAGGAIESGADVNGDGYDDILVGAIQNSAGGTSAGAAYVIYGQAGTLSATTLGDSSIVKFTGEEAGDLAGIDLSMVGDVNNDGYDDLLVGGSMNDEVASNAGAAYLIFGQSDPLTSVDLSDSSVEKFLGENASDIAGDVVSATGSVNGDSFAEILISAYAHDGSYTDNGAIYLGYLYIDEDGDGVAGDGGLFSGDDCNDSDEYINPDALEVQDEADNNCDGEIDEINTGTHPNFGDYDPTDTTLHDDTIVSVVGDIDGNIKVGYIDDSLFQYNIFDISSTKLTKVKHYRSTGYYLVLNPQGKKIALVNVFNGQVLSRKVLSKKVGYKYNSIKVFKLRKKYWAVITSKKSNGRLSLSTVKILIGQEKLGKKVTAKLTSKKVKVSKTSKAKNNITLKNKSSKQVQKYFFSKKYKLIKA